MKETPMTYESNNKELGRAPSGTGSNPSDQAPAGLVGSRFDPSRVRHWLIVMSKQGEDQVWRGAQKALACFDALIDENIRLHGLCKANNELARMNGQHRDEWRVKAVRYAEALDAIAQPLDCGCVPCRGQCRSQIALECEVEARQDIAREALCDSDGNPEGEDRNGLRAEHDSAGAQHIAETQSGPA
jgi:hypothetical protein